MLQTEGITGEYRRLSLAVNNQTPKAVNSEGLMHKQHKVEPNQMCVVWLKSPQLPVSAFWVLDTILNLLCLPTNLITSPL